MLDVAVRVNDTGATYSTFLSVTSRPEFFGMIELGARVRSERRLLIVRKLGGRVSFFSLSLPALFVAQRSSLILSQVCLRGNHLSITRGEAHR